MKCKLLVAEDELIERKVLCKTLKKYLGDLIVLYEARNGREAVELFEREAPQVVILDIEMPGLTGLEVARKIRETDKNCGILFLTGFDKFSYAKQAISVRALDYLLKPYKEQELVFAVEDAIRQVSSQVPHRPEAAPAAPVLQEEADDVRTAIIRAEMYAFIEAHYPEDISMQDAAAALRYSDAYFCKLFKQCFKVNFSTYLNEFRVQKAQQLMTDARLSLKDISTACGYSDANYFTRVFKRITGQTPSEYRLAAARFVKVQRDEAGCFASKISKTSSFFRPEKEKIVLGYNKDKIVLAIAKNSCFKKMNDLLELFCKEKRETARKKGGYDP